MTPARRQGIAKALTQAAVQATRQAGHLRLALHASDAGRPLYAALGSKPGTEMWLEL